MKAMKWLDKYFEEVVLAALLFVMMMIMGIQVLARYALGNSLSWSEEITRFCFIWTGFLSISFCIKNSADIKIEQFIDLFENVAGGKIKIVFKTLVNVAEFILFAYLLPFAYHYVHSAYISQSTSPACGIPMWAVQSITLISFVMCEIRIIQKFLKHVRQFMGKEPVPKKLSEQTSEKEGVK
ncbi:MAG: TRAP transporter small permease [Eubacteriales bacterium]|nr:TRAP transporter small permease [Eubacteriales bacterium]